MKNIFSVLLIFVSMGWGCGGSKPSSSDVVSLTEVQVPEYPIQLEKPKEGKGMIKLYMKAYDHCKEQGGCDEEEDIETEEDRQRYSVPYRRK